MKQAATWDSPAKLLLHAHGPGGHARQLSLWPGDTPVQLLEPCFRGGAWACLPLQRQQLPGQDSAIPPWLATGLVACMATELVAWCSPEAGDPLMPSSNSEGTPLIVPTAETSPLPSDC